MAIEIGGRKPRPIDFTFEGEPLFVRQLPLRLGLKLQSESDDDMVPAEIIAEIIAECVVNKGGNNVFDVDSILGFDTKDMLELFSAVSGEASVKEAEKN